MKTLHAIVALFVIVYVTAVAGIKLEDAQDGCLIQLKITDWDLEHNWANDGSSTKRNCFTACVNKKMGVMTPNGDWIVEKVKNLLIGVKNAAAIAAECCRTKTTDACKSAAALEKCFRSKGIKELK